MWQQLLDEKAWLRKVGSDKEATLAGRWTEISLSVICDGVANGYSYRPGTLSRVTDAEAPQASISFSGSSSAWNAFLDGQPLPPNHHFLGMERRRSDFSVAVGKADYIRHLRFLTRVFELARDCASDTRGQQ